MNNEILWTFKTWIERFKDVDLPIGDLAKDILTASDFPDDDVFISILKYFQHKSADAAIIETFCLVWNFYLASNASPDGLVTLS